MKAARGADPKTHVMNRKPLILLLFFASGFCGLVYEVVWMRHLSLVFGNTVYATSTVLAGFMGGLAIGSLLFGKVADRVKNPLRLYGILELLIGALALLFPLILRGLTPLYLWYAKISGSSYHALSFAQSILLIGLLLIPTTLMGGTLPVLTKYLSHEFSSLGRSLSLLYGLNTLGAVIGCAAAGFWLVGSLGVRLTTWVAVAINVAVGVIALVLGRQPTAVENETPAAAPTAATSPQPVWFRRLLLTLFAVSGFAAMAYEVLWMRVLTFLAGGTSYSFTVMLTTYLLGLALGSLLIARLVDRTKRLVEAFSVLQLLTGLVVLATLAAAPLLLEVLGGFLGPKEAPRFSDLTGFILLQGAISLAFIFPATLLAGMTFPVVARLFTTSHRQTGTDVGVAYFADTIGAIGGSLLAGFLLIPQFGTLESLKALALVNLLIGIVALAATSAGGREIRFSLPRLAGLTCGVVAVFFVARSSIPKNTFAEIFTAPDATLDYIREDLGGTVTIENYGDHRTISINGINVAGTDLKFEATQKLQAHLALLLHPHPEKVLQIGFGSGGTAWSITRHPVREIDCVEITAAVINARGHFEDTNHDVLADKRVRVCLDDARSYLVKCDQQYDAILSDSIHPRYAGNGGLYATDYYRLCQQHLKTNGIFSAWLPMHGMALEDFRVATRSLKAVFPHVYLFHTPVGRTEWTIILGMNQPLNFDLDLLNAKLTIPAVHEDLNIIRMARAADILNCFMIGDTAMSRFLGSSTDLNTDDLPYLELVTPRSTIRGSREALLVPLYTELIKQREPVFPYVRSSTGPLPAGYQASYESSDHVLQARLTEVLNPSDTTKVRQELETALQLDPGNNVARNLLERFGVK